MDGIRVRRGAAERKVADTPALVALAARGELRADDEVLTPDGWVAASGYPPLKGRFGLADPWAAWSDVDNVDASSLYRRMVDEPAELPVDALAPVPEAVDEVDDLPSIEPELLVEDTGTPPTRRAGPPIDRRAGPPIDRRAAVPPVDRRTAGPPVDRRVSAPPVDRRPQAPVGAPPPAPPQVEPTVSLEVAAPAPARPPVEPTVAPTTAAPAPALPQPASVVATPTVLAPPAAVQTTAGPAAIVPPAPLPVVPPRPPAPVGPGATRPPLDLAAAQRPAVRSAPPDGVGELIDFPRRAPAFELPPQRPRSAHRPPPLVRTSRLVAMVVAGLLAVLLGYAWIRVNAWSRAGVSAPPPARPAASAPAEPKEPSPLEAVDDQLRLALPQSPRPVTKPGDLSDALYLELAQQKLDVVMADGLVTRWSGRLGDQPRSAEVRIQFRSAGDLTRELAAVALVVGRYKRSYGLDIPVFEVVELGTGGVTRIDPAKAEAYYQDRLAIEALLSSIAGR